MLAGKMMDLFAGLTRAYGTYRITGTKDSKVDGQAVTVQGELTEDHWQRHLSGETGLGVIPITDDNTVRFAAIDIDVYDLDLPELEKRVKKLNLPLVLCRTKSGGAHLYLFLSEPHQAKLVRQRMAEFAAALGYPGVEIFPKQDKLASKEDVGNWINMPYYDAERTTRYAIRNGKALSLEQFVQHAGNKRTDDIASIEVQPPEEKLPGAPPCLQTLAINGVPPGMRNNALYNFGVLAKLMDEEHWADTVGEFNMQFMDKPLPLSEVNSIIKSLNRKSYFYKCKEPPIASLCNKAVCRTCEYGIGDSGDDPGVQVEGLTKICTVPPTWIVQVSGIRLQLETDDLLQQQRFARKCVERINFLPPTIKTDKWKRFINELLQNVREVEAPQDSSDRGLFLFHFEQFCTTKAPANTRDELLMGKPFHHEGRTYFRASDLVRYLEQNKFRAYRGHQIYAQMKEAINELGHHQYNLKGKCVNVWSVPAFEQQTEEFDVPRIPEEEF
jgi:hypothetical protein